MERNALLCILYLTLLLAPAPILANARTEKEQPRNKRYVALRRAQTSYGDSHSCANNWGWCRRRCFRIERVNWYYSGVCGSYYCCISTI
ncbi:big defensin-like [Saccostrea cucullata]|uniref:big defensin-like n=1 Tax=Saccostrea cuccullata TaxID=36930 RepID=UPI002ED4F462